MFYENEFFLLYIVCNIGVLFNIDYWWLIGIRKYGKNNCLIRNSVKSRILLYKI